MGPKGIDEKHGTRGHCLVVTEEHSFCLKYPPVYSYTAYCVCLLIHISQRKLVNFYDLRVGKGKRGLLVFGDGHIGTPLLTTGVNTSMQHTRKERKIT